MLNQKQIMLNDDKSWKIVINSDKSCSIFIVDSDFWKE